MATRTRIRKSESERLIAAAKADGPTTPIAKIKSYRMPAATLARLGTLQRRAQRKKEIDALLMAVSAGLDALGVPQPTEREIAAAGE